MTTVDLLKMTLARAMAETVARPRIKTRPTQRRRRTAGAIHQALSDVVGTTGPSVGAISQ